MQHPPECPFRPDAFVRAARLEGRVHYVFESELLAGGVTVRDGPRLRSCGLSRTPFVMAGVFSPWPGGNGLQPISYIVGESPRSKLAVSSRASRDSTPALRPAKVKIQAIAEAFVETLKCGRIRVNPLPDAEMAVLLTEVWIEDDKPSLGILIWQPSRAFIRASDETACASGETGMDQEC